MNVGTPRLIEWLGQRAMTAIWKEPATGRVRVEGLNVAGEDQADRTVHGGPDKAIYAYAREDQEWWQTELGRELPPGVFGENFTVREIEVTSAVIGERWRVGPVLLVEVAQPRISCWRIGARMDNAEFPPRFAAARRPDAYLRILEEGGVGAGDLIDLVSRPSHGVTVGDVARIYQADCAQASVLLEAPELAEGWRAWARKRVT